MKNHFQDVYGGGAVEDLDLEMALEEVMERAIDDLLDAEELRQAKVKIRSEKKP